MSIVTRAALREMIRPAVLALGAPIVLGVLFKWFFASASQPLLAVEVLAALLLFGTLTGLLMAMFLDNSGGAVRRSWSGDGDGDGDGYGGGFVDASIANKCGFVCVPCCTYQWDNCKKLIGIFLSPSPLPSSLSQ